MTTLKNLWMAIKNLANPDWINATAGQFGSWIYVILFAVIFAETGLVVTPFLPGDSLLFAVGAVSAMKGSPIHLPIMAAILILAAILGDAVNYFLGLKIGPKVFSREDSWLLNKKHLGEAQRFYDRYGAKTIILARFVPIVRTFAPFVAGIGRMNFLKFAAYNVIGGAAWVLVCLLAGWKFGNLEFVKKHFELVILAIIAVSLLPPAIEFFLARGRRRPVGEAMIEAATTIGEDEPRSGSTIEV